MFVITFQKFFIGLSACFVAVSIAAVVVFGIPLGIDFKGGSQLEVRYPNGRPEIASIKSSLTTLPDALIQPTGDNGISIKTHTNSGSRRPLMMYFAT